MPVVVLTARDVTAAERVVLDQQADRVVVKGSVSLRELAKDLRELAPPSGDVAPPGSAPGPAGTPPGATDTRVEIEP